MSIRRKVGQSGAVIVAVFLAITHLTVLPASTQPGVAQDPCTPSEPNVIDAWDTWYDDRGVTLCRGDVIGDPFQPSAFVQIIDMDAGANLRLISDRVEPWSLPAMNGDDQYNKRSASQWFNWIQSNVDSPGSDRLFSTANASFFVDTSSSTTALSLPAMNFQQNVGDPPFHSVQHQTYGWAYGHNSDPAWDAVKRVLRIGDLWSGMQQAQISTFPTHYTIADIELAFGDLFDGNLDGLVGVDPTYEIGGPGGSRRTMFGSSDDTKKYILTADVNITLSEAQDILKSFGSQVEIQLDGGGSTQMHSSIGDIPSYISRAVPDVLAVYLAPN